MRVRIFVDLPKRQWKIHWESDRWWREFVPASYALLKDVSWVVVLGRNAYAQGELVGAVALRSPIVLPEPHGTLVGPQRVRYHHGVDRMFHACGEGVEHSGAAEFRPDGSAWAGEDVVG